MSDEDDRLSIPPWQNARSLNSDLKQAEKQAAQTPPLESSTSSTHDDLLELARDFLNDESVRGEPRERKVEFLQSKGLGPEDVEKLLSQDSSRQSQEQGIKTVHDSTVIGDHSSATASATSTEHKLESQPSNASSQASQRDMPPIITYPEFLLKPQKPPPLVTFKRLAYAAYSVAGLSALAYATDKYLVEPMVETLTEARHELASQTIDDLQKLNTQLESRVSHIPYAASAAALKARSQYEHDHEDDSDTEASDPTELFHRDIATQTSPDLARSPSSTSLTEKPLNASLEQNARLSSLVTSLESLNATLNPDPAMTAYLPATSSKKLQDTMNEFQAVLDKLASTYNPFRTDYSSIYSPLTDGETNKNKDNNEAARFRAEIRSLKGAFLSSRNFPSARPVSGFGSR